MSVSWGCKICTGDQQCYQSNHPQRWGPRRSKVQTPCWGPESASSNGHTRCQGQCYHIQPHHGSRKVPWNRSCQVNWSPKQSFACVADFFEIVIACTGKIVGRERKDLLPNYAYMYLSLWETAYKLMVVNHIFLSMNCKCAFTGIQSLVQAFQDSRTGIIVCSIAIVLYNKCSVISSHLQIPGTYPAKILYVF